MKRLALTMREVPTVGYHEPRDAIAFDWTGYLESRGYYPLYVPNTLENPVSFIESFDVDGLIVTGGNTVVSDGRDRPGVSASRDKTEYELITHAIHSDLPVLGVCRGLQMINVHFGGQVTNGLTDVDGLHDQHVAADHPIVLQDDWQAAIGQMEITVNSFHDDAVLYDQVAPSLRIMATTRDRRVAEAVQHESLPIIGIQWHPERENPADEMDSFIFDKLFDEKRVRQ